MVNLAIWPFAVYEQPSKTMCGIILSLDANLTISISAYRSGDMSDPNALRDSSLPFKDSRIGIVIQDGHQFIACHACNYTHLRAV